MPAARRQQATDLAALFGREHLGRVGQGLDEMLAHGVMGGDLSARSFSSAPRSIVCCVRSSRPVARAASICPAWNQVLDRGFYDRLQLVLLFGSGIDLDGEMAYHPIGMGIDNAP